MSDNLKAPPKPAAAPAAPVTWKSPRAALEALQMSGKTKSVDDTWDQVLILSIMGGAYVSLGAYLALVIGGNVPLIKHDNPGIQRLLYGMAFSTGLMYIIFTGSHLLTGNIFAIPLWLYSKKTTFRSFLNGLKGMFFCALGNFIGAVLVAYFLVYLPNYDSTEPWVEFVKALAVKKTTRPVHLLMLSSLGCNVIVASCLYMYSVAQDSIGRIFTVFFPITAFGAYGFEHVVANMFFLPLAGFYGAQIEVWRIFFWNLLPVLIGNYIGGAVLIGLPFWYAHLWRNKHHDLMDNAIATLKKKIAKKNNDSGSTTNSDSSVTTAETPSVAPKHIPEVELQKTDTFVSEADPSQVSVRSSTEESLVPIPHEKPVNTYV